MAKRQTALAKDADTHIVKVGGQGASFSALFLTPMCPFTA
jgi:hypothetical protein